jgi:hypothetical protein
VAKGGALAKAKKWRDQQHQKTDDGNITEEEEVTVVADKEDAVATLGANVEDLEEAQDVVTATLPAR